MIKRLISDRILVLLVVLALGVKFFSSNEAWVERYYTYGLYPFISQALRFLFGWLPFSFGDLLYAAAVIYLISKAIKVAKQVRLRTIKTYLSLALFSKIFRIVLLVYLSFNLLWGLNYNRQGIAVQLGLQVKPYTVQDLDTITGLLQKRLNSAAMLVGPLNRKALEKNKILFQEGGKAYRDVAKTLPFLKYDYASIKPSMFSHIGHFFGFTGYYNPFSGEGHIKTTVPFFLKPFVLTHEMAHQLGYGKENEANFVGFFACRSSKNPEFQYSVYYDMYQYAARELYRRDSLKAKSYKKRLHPQVIKDNQELRQYLRRSSNIIEPFVTAFYGEYLRMNNQPNGKLTYNEVVAWLIAYQKKYGLEAI